MDYAYAKIGEDGSLIEAPNPLKTDTETIINPTKEKYEQYGYFPVDPTEPGIEEGYRRTGRAWYFDEPTKTIRVRVTDKKVIDVRPEVDDHHRIYDCQWEETETEIIAHYRVFEVIDVPPTEPPQEGYEWTKAGEDVDEEAETITVRYEQVPLPPPPVFRYSKLKLEVAMAKMGKLDAFDAFIDGLDLDLGDGVTVKARRFYDQANDLASDNPLFAPYKAKAAEALGITPEEADAILAQCIAE